MTGLTRAEIAKREGFGNTPRPEDSSLTDWDAFIEAYYGINATKFLDDDRQDYFIGFELLTSSCYTETCNGCTETFSPDQLNWSDV